MLLLENLKLHLWLAFVAHILFLLDGSSVDLRSAGLSCKTGPHGKYFRFLGHSVPNAATPPCCGIERAAQQHRSQKAWLSSSATLSFYENRWLVGLACGP